MINENQKQNSEKRRTCWKANNQTIETLISTVENQESRKSKKPRASSQNPKAKRQKTKANQKPKSQKPKKPKARKPGAKTQGTKGESSPDHPKKNKQQQKTAKIYPPSKWKQNRRSDLHLFELSYSHWVCATCLRCSCKCREFAWNTAGDSPKATEGISIYWGQITNRTSHRPEVSVTVGGSWSITPSWLHFSEPCDHRCC